MKEFSYHKPSSVSEAIALLAASGENRPLSGGMTLLPTMKQRLASPSALIDLTALSKALGAPRFSFGAAELLIATLGIEPGSVRALTSRTASGSILGSGSSSCA